MTGRLLRPLMLVIVGLLLAVPSAPAHAQSGGSGCPPPSAIEENDQILFGRTWLPMRIGIDVAKATCRVHDFMVEFFKRQPDPDKASLDDYIEASKPDDGDGGDQTYRAKMRTMPSPTKNPGWNPNPSTSIVVLPPNTSGGVPVLFQANAPGGPIPTTVADIQGNGTLLSAEGMKRGTFEKGKLNGVGEEIDPNGTWRSGTYESGRNMGQVWEVRKVAGKTYLASGSVVNGKLDGMIERIFADGSTQFEDWEGGKLMQVGVRAPKGQSATAPQARYQPVEEAELEDAYKKIGPRTKIAPGTTFDPAKTVSPSNTANRSSLGSRYVSVVPARPELDIISLKTSELTIIERVDGLAVTSNVDGVSGLYRLIEKRIGGRIFECFCVGAGTLTITLFDESPDFIKFAHRGYAEDFRRIGATRP